MNNIFFFALAFILKISTAYSSSELFSLDEARLDQKFREISMVEQIVLESDDPESLLAVKDFSNSYAHMLSPWNMAENPLGIPSFIWGCTLGWVGILMVHVIEEDKEETKKALYGCITQGASCIVLNMAYVVVMLSVMGI